MPTSTTAKPSFRKNCLDVHLGQRDSDPSSRRIAATCRAQAAAPPRRPVNSMKCARSTRPPPVIHGQLWPVGTRPARPRGGRVAPLAGRTGARRFARAAACRGHSLCNRRARRHHASGARRAYRALQRCPRDAAHRQDGACRSPRLGPQSSRYSFQSDGSFKRRKSLFRSYPGGGGMIEAHRMGDEQG
jgi:hypothetical protein